MTLFATAADSAIVEFLNKHLVLMALTASAGWFYAGKDYFRKGNLVGAFLWQGIAVLILIAFCLQLRLPRLPHGAKARLTITKCSLRHQ
jgi:hypothetical protein